MIVTQELTYEDVIRAAMRKTLDEIGKDGVSCTAYGKSIQARQPESVKDIHEVLLTVEIDMEINMGE